MYVNYASQSTLRFKSINFAGRSWSTQSTSASPSTLTTMHGSTCQGMRKIMHQSESNMCQQESKESKTNIDVISYIVCYIILLYYIIFPIGKWQSKSVIFDK